MDSLNAIFAACYDLIHVGYNITLKFGFCNIYLMDRNLTYTFSPEIIERLDNLVESETRLKRGISPVSNTWKTTAVSKWAKSS